MPSGAGDALSEAEVRPRAIRDGDPLTEDEIDLLVVEVHAMGDEHVRSERTERVEMGEWAAPGTSEVGDGICAGRRHVECQPRRMLPGEIARRRHELVGHQVVSDERDPAAAHGRVRR